MKGVMSMPYQDASGLHWVPAGLTQFGARRWNDAGSLAEEGTADRATVKPIYVAHRMARAGMPLRVGQQTRSRMRLKGGTRRSKPATDRGMAAVHDRGAGVADVITPLPPLTQMALSTEPYQWTGGG